MNKVAGEKENFCKSLPWTLPIRWYDLTGLLPLKGRTMAKVELCTYGEQGTYSGFTVKIVRDGGSVVDQKTFLFDDYLQERADERADEEIVHGFCIVRHCGWKWYIAVPKHPWRFTQAIEAYVKEWEGTVF